MVELCCIVASLVVASRRRMGLKTRRLRQPSRRPHLYLTPLILVINVLRFFRQTSFDIQPISFINQEESYFTDIINITKFLINFAQFVFFRHQNPQNSLGLSENVVKAFRNKRALIRFRVLSRCSRCHPELLQA